MYHHVNPNKGDMITVAPEVFEAQMRHVKEAGFRTLSLDEVAAFIRGEFKPKERCVAVTFDDGYLDNYVHAWPILKRYGIKAAVFIVTDWASKATASGPPQDLALIKCPSHQGAKELIAGGQWNKAVLTWAMAREMRESGLVEFQSHTATHCLCDAIPFDMLSLELRSSKQTIENELGTPCSHLCWPKGRHSKKAVEMAREAGYSGLFTTRFGTVRPGDGLREIKRIPAKDGVAWFKTRLMIYTNPVLAGVYARIKR